LLPAAADADASGAEAAAIGGVGWQAPATAIDAADADGRRPSTAAPRASAGGPAGAAATREPPGDSRGVVLRGGRGAASARPPAAPATVRGGGCHRWRTRGVGDARAGRARRGFEGGVGAGFSPSTSVTSGATCESLRCGGNAACADARIRQVDQRRIDEGGRTLRVILEAQPTVR